MLDNRTNKINRLFTNASLKNLSNKQLKECQINLLAKGLKFIPTPVTKDNQIRQHLRDFEHFTMRMRLQYMHLGAGKEQHPFYVKSNWNPPVQQSVTLESYLEEVKISITEINFTKPSNVLPPAEREELKTLKGDKQINPNKADKGTNTVMNKEDILHPDQNLQIYTSRQTNGRNEPLHKYTTGRGNKYSVHSIRNFLQ